MNKCSRIFAIVTAFLCIFGFSGCEDTTTKSTTDTGFNIHMIDVGQGDSILLECDNTYMLIDAGEVNEGDEVVDYLQENNINKLDYALITHPHSDHYGGMETVLKNIETENIIMSEAVNTTRTWESLVDYIDEQDYNVIFPTTNDTFSLGGCTLTAYVPQIEDDLNNCSIVVRADYNGMSAIFTGDAEKSEESKIIESDFNISANILKVGHHGSSTSTSDNFLEKVKPQLALISCGENNDYGHPHKETTAKLEEADITSLRTDKLGDILVSLADNKIKISTDNGYSNELDINTSSVNTSNKNDNTENQSAISDTTYIGNKNSHVFHSSDCSSVNKMSDKNKVYFTSRSEATDSGYTPCQSCKP